MTIRDLGPGQSAVIVKVNGEGTLRQHFLDMGLIPGTQVTFLKLAPLGDPMEIQVQGYSLTLRLADAAQIDVVLGTASEQRPDYTTERDLALPYMHSLHDHNSHPGFGEDGPTYHDRHHESAIPKGETLTFALVGQQNTGKTSLFNVLTGSNQHVGNFPGVTVDRKDGVIRGHTNTLLTDLPGVYSLSPYTAEELVTRQFILEQKPKAIINIVDASNIERNLYLTMQLITLGVPMVLALNMMDEVHANGGSIRVNEMESILGLPVVPISAAKNEGVDELVDHVLHVAKYQEAPQRSDFCAPDDNGGSVHRCLHSLMHIIEDKALARGIPVRFAATKLAEGDLHIADELSLDETERSTVEHIIVSMESERGLDRGAAIADMRYTFIHKLCSHCVVRPKESKEQRRSRHLDRVLTGKYTAIPIFIVILALIFWLTFDVVGVPLQVLLDGWIQGLGGQLDALMMRGQVNPTVRSLIVDAIFGGVGNVLSFVPIIVIMFLFLSLLEDSGYMARIAFISDELLRKIGLSGRSIVPMLLGFGCSVPAVMASRTLPSAYDRRRTVLLIPFMSCSAKIAIYAFFAAAFFPHHAGLVMISLYLLGILVGLLVALISKHVRGSSEPAPFVMELPTYRLPRLSNVGHLLWDKTKDFIHKAFSVIFIATLVIWLLETFNFRLNPVTDSQDSMMAWLGGLIAPLFRPMGLDDWRIITSLISGFMAKESVVSTMALLGVTGSMTVLTAVPMLIFCLLYTPCAATIATISREQGHKWAIFVVVFQCVIAYVCALLGYLVAQLIV